MDFAKLREDDGPMTTHADDQPSLGAMIERAREDRGLSQNAAAELAKMSGTRWRQIVSGDVEVMLSTRGVRRLARMCQIVGLSPQQVRAARADVADELERAPDDLSIAERVADEIERDPALRERWRRLLSGPGHPEQSAQDEKPGQQAG